MEDGATTVIEDLETMNASVDPTGPQLRSAAGNTIEVLWDDTWFDALASRVRVTSHRAPVTPRAAARRPSAQSQTRQNGCPAGSR